MRKKKPRTYVQFGQDAAQVYVYMSEPTTFEPKPHLACGLCFLGDEFSGWEHRSLSTEDMINHLDDHERAGHHVPGYVYEALTEEDGVNFK